MEKIVVYAAEGCPKCMVLKKQLSEKGIPYEVCNDIDYMVEKKGFDHVPMMEIGSTQMNYKEALKWVSER